jgi:hypothetical protein
VGQLEIKSLGQFQFKRVGQILFNWMGQFRFNRAPEPVLANWTIDRMFENPEIIPFKGDSYRLKGRIKTKEINTTNQA